MIKPKKLQQNKA